MPQETITLPEDSLAVTVASASVEQTDPLASDLSIWVGEVTLNGRQTIWVELIDAYGEVIYGSEVNTNETHLLPDGRAVVVRSIDPETAVAKIDESRVVSDAPLVVTRRVMHEGETATSVEFIETTEKPIETSALLNVAAFGEAVWSGILGFFEAAVNRVQVAWNWLVDTLHA
ncbi:MAG: hypothetical protein JJ902_03725 [Roseibium sp.]|nr:hypothetical protein [Roseibium sp.]